MDFLIDFARILAPLGPHLAPKISPKINTSRPWSTGNPQEPAREPGDHQKAPKMEPKVSPGPPKSDLWPPQGLQNGAPDTPKTSPKPVKIASQNATEINPNFIQEAKKNTSKINPNVPNLETKMDPTWSSAGTKFCCTIWPNILKEMPQRG